MRLSTKQKQWLIHKRDDAINASASHHGRMARDIDRYNAGKDVHGARLGGYDRNEVSLYQGETVGNLKPLSADVIYNKIGETVDKVLPRMEEGNPRAYYLPYEEATEEQAADVTVLERWMEMIAEVDGEADKQRVNDKQTLMMGNTVRKCRLHPWHGYPTAEPISPLSVSVDPMACDIGLNDCTYLVHSVDRSYAHIKRHYPKFRRQNKDDDGPHRIDEMWVRTYLADDEFDTEELGARHMIKVVLIDDRVIDIDDSPWAFPGFPFVFNRAFTIVNKTGKPNGFWGYGYGSDLWNMQMLLDELLSEFMLILRNQSVGQFLTTEGALTIDLVEPIHGLIIELEEGKTLADAMRLDPSEPSALSYQMLQLVLDIFDSYSGINASFKGEAPFAGISGRAVTAMQAAAFTAVSNLIRGKIEFKKRLARLKASIVQQKARKPVDPNLWRGGYQMPGQFPESARHVPFKIEIQDTSSLPQTPAGKAQLVQMVAGLAPLRVEKIIELLGLDSAYRLEPNDFLSPVTGQAAGIPTSEDVMMGRDTAPAT